MPKETRLSAANVARIAPILFIALSNPQAAIVNFQGISNLGSPFLLRPSTEFFLSVMARFCPSDTIPAGHILIPDILNFKATKDS